MIESGPCASTLRRIASATRSIASSQPVTRVCAPLRSRTIGRSSRSPVSKIGASSAPFAQSLPRLTGWSGSPRTSRTTPSVARASTSQPVPQ